jgi:dihydrofolate reductase
MRKLAVIEFVTLDGVMQGLGSPDDDREGGFQYGGWGQPYGDEVLRQKAAEGMRDTTAYLLGRRTYEKMAAYWPHQPDDNPIAAHFNAAPKYVVTRTLTRLDWVGSEPLGSGVLVQALIENEQVDEYRLFVHPLVLGTGKRLFREYPRPLQLRLVDCTPTSTGVLLLTYVR